MGFIREFVNKRPWLGWVIAGLFLALSVLIYTRLSGANDPYTVQHLSERVTIKCSETGEEWTMTRGRMEQLLRARAGPVDLKEGLPNPKTGKLTGFPVDRGWQETVVRLNQEREEVIKERAGAVRPNKPPVP